MMVMTKFEMEEENSQVVLSRVKTPAGIARPFSDGYYSARLIRFKTKAPDIKRVKERDVTGSMTFVLSYIGEGPSVTFMIRALLGSVFNHANERIKKKLSAFISLFGSWGSMPKVDFETSEDGTETRLGRRSFMRLTIPIGCYFGFTEPLVAEAYGLPAPELLPPEVVKFDRKPVYGYVNTSTDPILYLDGKPFDNTDLIGSVLSSDTQEKLDISKQRENVQFFSGFLSRQAIVKRYTVELTAESLLENLRTTIQTVLTEINVPADFIKIQSSDDEGKNVILSSNKFYKELNPPMTVIILLDETLSSFLGIEDKLYFVTNKESIYITDTARPLFLDPFSQKSNYPITLVGDGVGRANNYVEGLGYVPVIGQVYENGRVEGQTIRFANDGDFVRFRCLDAYHNYVTIPKDTKIFMTFLIFARDLLEKV